MPEPIQTKSREAIILRGEVATGNPGGARMTPPKPGHLDDPDGTRSIRSLGTNGRHTYGIRRHHGRGPGHASVAVLAKRSAQAAPAADSWPVAAPTLL